MSKFLDVLSKSLSDNGINTFDLLLEKGIDEALLRKLRYGGDITEDEVMSILERLDIVVKNSTFKPLLNNEDKIIEDLKKALVDLKNFK